MPKSPSPKQQFYNYLLALNKHLSKKFKLNENNIIYIAQKNESNISEKPKTIICEFILSMFGSVSF